MVNVVDWTRIQHFSAHEFDSPDVPGSGEGMDKNIILRLDFVRADVQLPIRVTSGIRTPIHNAKIGGSHTSSHLSGKAVDIACLDSHTRFLLIAAALRYGIRRIGVGKNFLHLDMDSDKAQSVAWVY